jgi:hypothetical protein
MNYVSFSQVPRLCLTFPLVPYKYVQNTSNATYLLLCDQKYRGGNSSEPSDSQSAPLPVPPPARMLLPRTSFPRIRGPYRPNSVAPYSGNSGFQNTLRYCHHPSPVIEAFIQVPMQCTALRSDLLSDLLLMNLLYHIITRVS